MRRRVIVSIVAIAVILATAFLSTADTTLARYTDVEAKPGQLGAATVVLGAASKTPTLAFANPAASGSVNATLTVVYAGTTTARLTVDTRPATSYASNFCSYNPGTGWRTRSIAGAVGPTITFSVAGTSVAYCTMLNGAEITLAPSVEAGSTTAYPVTATYSGLLNGLFAGKTDTVPLRLHAYSTSGSGFNHTATGTLSVSTAATAAAGPRALTAARAAPSSTSPTTTAAAPVPAVTAADLPPECAGRSPASFAEKVVLTPANPAFDAARDRPGVAGPFLVVGSAAGDTIVGSAGADCLVGGDGDDTISGGAGDDVLIGGAGVDHLNGDPGADLLYGGPAVDVLDGGAGADLLDGGVDGATCTTDPTDTTTGCLPPAESPTAVVPEGVPATSDPAPVPEGAVPEGGPENPPTPVAPQTPEGGAVPEGGADPTAAPPPT